MAVAAQNRTNQKLYFAQAQLEKLKLLEVSNAEHLERRAGIETCFTQLFFAYRAVVCEIAACYELELALFQFDLDASTVFLPSLDAALKAKGFSSPELMHLSQLAGDQDSWLNLLLMRFKQAVDGDLSISQSLPDDAYGDTYGEESALQPPRKKIQLIDIQNKKRLSSGFISELELLYTQLKDLVDEFRDTLQEY